MHEKLSLKTSAEVIGLFVETLNHDKLFYSHFSLWMRLCVSLNFMGMRCVCDYGILVTHNMCIVDILGFRFSFFFCRVRNCVVFR